MRPLVVPRSVWPARCHRVSAWHRDEHITPLLRSEDELALACNLRQPQDTLDPQAIQVLVDEAVNGESVYRVTAAMDLLYDAHESYSAILDAFAVALLAGDPKTLRRVRCCIGYLRLGENRREILGKHLTEIMADWEHFKALAAKAEAFLGGGEVG